MSSEFFNDIATLLSYAIWTLFDGLTSATLSLTGTKPTVPFRCAVTLSSVTGHTDCAGTVTIGSEIITFVEAGRKTSATLLTALPTITTSGLDCGILITCIDLSGDDLQNETGKSIAVDWDDSTKYVPNAEGNFTRSDSNCETEELGIVIGDKLIHNGKTFTVKNIKTGEHTLAGTELTKILLF